MHDNYNALFQLKRERENIILKRYFNSKLSEGEKER
jgi:hypothetical protein